MPPIHTSAILTDGSSVLFEVDDRGGGVLAYSLPRFAFAEHEDSIEDSLAFRLREHLGIRPCEQEFVDTLYERLPGLAGVTINNLQLVTAWEGTPLERSATGTRTVWVPLGALNTMDLPADLLAALLSAFGIDLRPQLPALSSPVRGRIIVLTGPTGVSRSTVARLICASLPRAALVELDYLRHAVISGSPAPHLEGGDAASTRGFASLTLRNAATLARNFSDAGYDVVIEGVLEQPHELDALLFETGDAEAYFVTLLSSPEERRRRGEARPSAGQMGEGSKELHGILSFGGELRGLRIDNSRMNAAETARLVLEQLGEAQVR